MSLTAGSRLGPYEIVAPIGAGGMGEVYRARDTRLSREVAVKVISPRLATEADQLRRFEQEARAASQLDHPNILVVHDIGSHEGSPYIVSELLDGESLREKLGEPLAPKKAVDYALQAARGLAAAHEKGIVHRDLKPENLFVTRDGRVKILDFGLAKLTQPAIPSVALTEALTASPATDTSIVMGTVGYMSPEQVMGKPLDARSDLFSLGVVLYEMLSGKAAFLKGTAAETMAAILKEEPRELSVENKSVSLGLERIVRHCLEKEPTNRFQSARDLGFDLETLSGTSATSAAATAPPAGKPVLRIGRLWLAGLAVTALAATAGHFFFRPAPPSIPTYRRLTFRQGNIGTARFAPDGRSVVYSASFEGQPLEIYTTRPEGPESTPVGLKNASLFSVSPSGELAISLREQDLVAPLSRGTLATVPLGGGAPRSIAEFVDYADWTPDGKQLAVIRFLESRGVELPLGKVLYSSDRRFTVVRVSPKGDRIALLGPTGPLLTVDLAGKSKMLAGPVLRLSQSVAWSPSGQEVWFDDRGEHGQWFLKAVDLSGRMRTVATAPVLMVLHDIARDGRVLLERGVVRRGVLGLVPGEIRERELSWFDGSRPDGLSDDGRLLLFTEVSDAAAGGAAHYLRKTDGSPAVRLGAGEALDLSPDGKWVIARTADSPKTLILEPTGTGASMSIDVGAFGSVARAAFFPDGKHLLVEATEPGSDKQYLYVQDIARGKPRAVSSKAFGFLSRPISPDGLWVAALGELTDDISILPISGGEPHTVPNTKDIAPICWSVDGKFLFTLGRNTGVPAHVVRIEVATGRQEPWKALAPPELTGLYAIGPVLMTPDGQGYVYGYSRATSSDLYLVEGLK